MDFAERGTENFLVIVCQMSGFMQIYKCPQKSTEQALLRLREWCAQYGAPMALSPPFFRITVTHRVRLTIHEQYNGVECLTEHKKHHCEEKWICHYI